MRATSRAMGLARGDDRRLIVSANELRNLLYDHGGRPFVLGQHFNADNVVEIAKSQFPRLEAQVAISANAEKTRRLLIVTAAICICVGAALVVFAPSGKEGVSYAVAAILALLPLGAIGVSEFRIRSAVFSIEGGDIAVSGDRKPAVIRDLVQDKPEA